MAVQGKNMTAEEFAELPGDDTFQELIRGEVRTSPPPLPPHGRTTLSIGVVLDRFVESNELGAVFVAAGFRVERDPDTVLAPDVCFVRVDRLASLGGAGYSDLVPDLVVEVVSPSESAREVDRRMREWLRLEARLGWAPNPRTRSVVVYRPGAEPERLQADASIEGHDVLPGFRCNVRDFFR